MWKKQTSGIKGSKAGEYQQIQSISNNVYTLLQCIIFSSFIRPQPFRHFLVRIIDIVYTTKPVTITELEVSIEQEGSQISIEMLIVTCDSIVPQCLEHK